MLDSRFQLFYSAQTAQASPKRLAAFIKELKFHTKDLHEQLGFFPKTLVYLYDSPQQKKILFGGGSTDVADIYTPSIHITLDGFPHASLRHELVHAALSREGFFGLGFHPNILLTEGVAVALAPTEMSDTVDATVGRLIREKKKVEISALFSPLFWLESGPRAYAIAGSFFSFLIDKFGLNKMVLYYNGASFKEVYKVSPERLEEEWKKQVLKKVASEQTSLDTKRLVLSASLFEDECPHTKTDYTKPRDDGPYLRLRQPLGWSPEESFTLG